MIFSKMNSSVASIIFSVVYRILTTAKMTSSYLNDSMLKALIT